MHMSADDTGEIRLRMLKVAPNYIDQDNDICFLHFRAKDVRHESVFFYQVSLSQMSTDFAWGFYSR